MAGFVTWAGHAENIRVACSVANLANDIYLISIAVLRLTWRLVFRSSSNRFIFFFFFFFFFFLPLFSNLLSDKIMKGIRFS